MIKEVTEESLGGHIDLSEAEKAKLIDELNKLKKIHKNFFSSFEVITPKISQAEVQKYRVCSFLSQNVQENFWIVVPGTKLFFDDMMVNYEREMGDNLDVKKELIEKTFYCCVNLVNSQFRKSDKWVVVGFMPVGTDLGLPWIWIHPYLRGQGIVRDFLMKYAINSGPLMFETPVKPRLQKVVAGLLEEILNCPEKSTKYCNGLKYYLGRRYDVSFSNVCDEDIYEIMACINFIHYSNPNIDKQDELTNLISMMRIRKYCSENPSKLKDIFSEADLDEGNQRKVLEAMAADMKRRMTLGAIADSYGDGASKDLALLKDNE